MFSCLPAHATFVADTKNVSDFVQKHFVSAINVCQFAQPKKHHGQQCVRNNVSLFTRALRVVLYFGDPLGRSKIQTTSKNSHRYYTTKRLIRDLLSNTPNWYVFVDIYSQGMRDRSMRSGTKLARKIKLTDWSTAGNLSNRSSGVLKYRVIFILVLSVICTLRSAVG